MRGSRKLTVFRGNSGGQVVHFENYGKDVIKKHKVSPDAWVQMVKQLAYGKMTGGKPAVTYESAQTRKFRLGRTEVIRSASNQSKAFVDAMLDPNGSVSPPVNLQKNLSTMRVANEQIHISTRNRTSNGPNSSEQLRRGISSMQPGLPMARVSIVTCLV
jgi:hypothetical protein